MLSGLPACGWRTSKGPNKRVSEGVQPRVASVPFARREATRAA
jgi:hypothetical protein